MEYPAWKASLKVCRSKLTTGIVAKVLPAIRPLLTEEECSRVSKDKVGAVDNVDEFVKILLTKDEVTFESFCSALEDNGYPDLARVLKGKEPSASQNGSLECHPSSGETSAKPVKRSIQVSEAAVGGKDWNFRAIWSYLIKLIQKKEGGCKAFGVMVVGETGSGKSTLINNLVGKDAVEEGHTFTSQTSTIVQLEMEVEGVPVVLYDTPGLGDSRDVKDDVYLGKIKAALDSGKIHLVIYCMKLSETRMRASLIRTFAEYHRIGVNWKHTVIALTFADCVPVPKQKKKEPGFNLGHFFNDRVAELRAYIADVLESRVRVPPKVAKSVKCYPSTSDTDETLANGEEWYVPLWLDILDLLSPGAAARFLEIHANNIEFSNPEDVVSDNTAPPTLGAPEKRTVADDTSSGCRGQDSSGTDVLPAPQSVSATSDSQDKKRSVHLDAKSQRRFQDILSQKFTEFTGWIKSWFFGGKKE